MGLIDTVRDIANKENLWMIDLMNPLREKWKMNSSLWNINLRAYNYMIYINFCKWIS